MTEEYFETTAVKIIKLIESKQPISTKDIADIVGCSIQNVNRILRKPKNAGYLIRQSDGKWRSN